MTETGSVLPPGYVLGKFEIEQEIGSGGFGITYKAFDTKLERLVAIKEYFPFNLAIRESTQHVSPKTKVAHDVEEYNWGLDRFLQEAQALALYNHPNIIRVIDSIEANATAYIIMEFADGSDLSRQLKQDLLPIERVKEIVIPLAEGLRVVHQAEMLHRDIKPGNIIIREDGSAVLIDFGAARQAIGVKSQSLSTLLTPGYAPIEQYSSRGDQGPWTDIYALSAVAYVALTGENLGHFEATDRIRNDKLPKLMDLYPQSDTRFLQAIDWGLQPEERDRPQSVDEWLAFMTEGGALPTKHRGVVEKKETSSKRDKPQKQRGLPQSTEPDSKKAGFWSGNFAGLAAILVGLCVAASLGYFALTLERPDTDLTSESTVSEHVPDQDKVSATPATTAVKPNVSNDPVAPAPTTAPPSQSSEPINSEQEIADYEVATKVNTSEAYEIYLRLHPDGKHRESAMREKARLGSG